MSASPVWPLCILCRISRAQSFLKSWTNKPHSEFKTRSWAQNTVHYYERRIELVHVQCNKKSICNQYLPSLFTYCTLVPAQRVHKEKVTQPPLLQDRVQIHVGPNATVLWEAIGVMHSATPSFQGKEFFPYKRLVSVFCSPSLTFISASIQLSPNVLNTMWEPLVNLYPISNFLKQRQCQSTPAFINYMLFMSYISVHKMILSYDRRVSLALVSATKLVFLLKGEKK